MTGQSIENLSGIGEICLEGIDIRWWVWERHEVEIQDFVAFTQEVRYHMSSSFTASPCKDLKFVSFRSSRIAQVQCSLTIFLPPATVGFALFDILQISENHKLRRIEWI